MATVGILTVVFDFSKKQLVSICASYVKRSPLSTFTLWQNKSIELDMTFLKGYLKPCPFSHAKTEWQTARLEIVF